MLIFLFPQAENKHFQPITESGQTSADAKHRLYRVCICFLFAKTERRSLCQPKTTGSTKPIAPSVIGRLSGEKNSSNTNRPRDGANGTTREIQPFRAAMAAARPSLWSVAARSPGCPLAQVTHSRPWEAPAAKRPSVNRREIAPNPYGSAVDLLTSILIP